ncbi:glycosyltransferase [Mucilaginibacter sp. SP1R1]|uniref:glycosyltransferase n=1 Tax=Mucilaginibacter sp. SP1R1 TaxID=2723091 RepID=UPI0017F0D169|nr:glycosyltransferase [Mucilaginibacter sp. SP1R1]MBB6150989.1 hypothetical protein [Mucilaginibacter sp. SP1R1]
MKRLLIISPYFPPSNTADMQRIRTSLPYFIDFGWDVEIVSIHENYTDINQDPLLIESIPNSIKIHKIRALNKKLTSKLGIGSIALRSIFSYKKKVNKLLRLERFDLIYFSTTQFPICILGAYWKQRFNIPYVIDMQDPWHSDYYNNKPKHQRPVKHWFSHRLNKWLEPIAMKKVDGLISVSKDYINDLKQRYPQIKNIPSKTITFGIFKFDTEIANKFKINFNTPLYSNHINIVCIGRGGADMYNAIKPLFAALKQGLFNDYNLFKNIRVYFLGTSYAQSGKGKKIILPLAIQYNLQDYIIESTDRLNYYHALSILQQADSLFIPGSDDPKYTASKIYPYLLTHKPILSIFHPNSPAIKELNKFAANYTYSYTDTLLTNKIIDFLKKIINKTINYQEYNIDIMDKYAASNLTKHQCLLFNSVINKNLNT